MDCLFIEHGLMIDKNALHDCCYIRDMTKGKPLIMNLNQYNMVDWAEFLTHFEFSKTNIIDIDKLKRDFYLLKEKYKANNIQYAN